MRRCQAPFALTFGLMLCAGLRESLAESPSLGGRPLAPLCCDAPAATVVRSEAFLLAFLLSGEPLAAEAGDAEAGRARTPGADRARAVQETLQSWADGSARLEPMTPARLRRLTLDYRARHSGHEIDIMAFLQKPVAAGESTRRFQWSLVSQTDDEAVLAAVPRDSAERLFVPGFEVAFSRQSGLPESVWFEGRGAGRLAVVLDQHRFVRPAEEHATILQTAALQTERPANRTAPNVLTSVQRQASELIAKGAPGESTPEVERILKGWEQAVALRAPTEVRFQRFTYDLVFNTERRGTGRALFADAALARVDIGPADLPRTAVSKRRDSAGESFQLQADKPEFWIWNGRQVTHANPAEMALWEWKLPEKAESRPFWLWGDFRLESALPFLHPVSAADLLQRFDVAVKPQNNETLRLTLKPRFKADRDHAREHEVILSATTFLPEAVRTLDPSGNVETVYAVTERHVGVLVSKELFSPKLEGWKRDR